MKMAKASPADMEMAMKLCSALEAIDRGFLPKECGDEDESESFYLNDDEACGKVLRHIYDILQGGSIGRVILGMYVLMDPINKLIDPDADTLEEHPETAANEKDAARYRWLRNNPAWVGYDADYRPDEVDAVVDVAIAKATGEAKP